MIDTKRIISKAIASLLLASVLFLPGLSAAEEERPTARVTMKGGALNKTIEVKFNNPGYKELLISFGKDDIKYKFEGKGDTTGVASVTRYQGRTYFHIQDKDGTFNFTIKTPPFPFKTGRWKDVQLMFRETASGKHNWVMIGANNWPPIILGSKTRVYSYDSSQLLSLPWVEAELQ